MKKTICLILFLVIGCTGGQPFYLGQDTFEKPPSFREPKEFPVIFENESPLDLAVQASINTLNYDFNNQEKIFTMPFSQRYQDIEGILTFRGGPMRNNASIGSLDVVEERLEKAWEFQTSYSPRWGGGAGWVGQASVIEWSPAEKDLMNLYPKFKTKEGLREIVYASLDGHVYFLDLDTGEQTRPAILIRNPIKGSVALDPRGYPLLYVGQGVPQTGEIGYRIYSLINGTLLTIIPGLDAFAYRNWGAFDGAPLIHKEDDALILGGENGIVYFVKLNTNYSREDATISIDPVISKYRYKQANNEYQGIENSLAVYKNIAYFADNGGGIQAIDFVKNQPVWINPPYDDTDATIVMDEEKGVPHLYTGSEIDKQGAKGEARLQKINGVDGSILWEVKIPGFSLVGNHPVNGGVLGTPIVGEGPLEGQVIFNISRYKTFNGGLLLSLDKVTGKELWRWEMPDYSWSSTVPVYTEDDRAYFVQGDSVGNLNLVAQHGQLITNINLGANIEASPIVMDNQIIVATRGGQIFNVKIK